MTDDAANRPVATSLGSTPSHSFRGQIEFELVVEMLGVRSTRRLRVRYEVDPEWEYCSTTGELRTGSGDRSIGVEILRRIEEMRWSEDLRELAHVSEEAGWEKIGLSGPGYVDEEVWQRLESIIEERVQQEDRLRREIRKLPPGSYPPIVRAVPAALSDDATD